MIRWISISLPLVLGLILAGVLSVGLPDVPTAALTRESALAAWELVQQNDSQAIRFERLGDHRYRFATERFPFDGELLVVNVAIDELGAVAFEGETGRIAIIETELVGLPEEFQRRHIQSIGMWERNNTLYYDEASQSWLSFSEWQKTFADMYQPPWWYGCLSWSSWTWLLILGGMVVVLVRMGRKANRQIDRTMSAQDKALADQERALQQQQEAILLTREAVATTARSNQLLAEILEELRKSA